MKKKTHKAKGYIVRMVAPLHRPHSCNCKRKNTTDKERERVSELRLDTESEKEEEDEYLELCGYGSQAHQREPLLRRQFHQPSRAQPNHSVTTLHFSHSLSIQIAYLGFFFFFVSIYEFGFSLSALGFY